MSEQKEDPILAITNSPLKDVLVRGFAQLYKQRPDFPIEFLGKWLKNYSQGQQKKRNLEQSRGEKDNRVAQLQRNIQLKAKKADEEKAQYESKLKNSEAEFNLKLNGTNYLVDLLGEYLPEYIQNSCKERNVTITGCYIGELKFRHKKLEEHSFEPGAQFDTENPKIIQYVGASHNQKFMVGQILSNQSGRSYEVFKEEDPPAEQVEQGKPLKVKKKYLYVPQVQRDEKIYFFKYPKLGSFACFPLRIKSCLSTSTFDKGIADYKAFVKNKQEVEKQYSQRYNEARSNYQESKRKYQEHEGNEQDPQFQADHANLQEQFKKNEQSFKDIESNPPVIEPFKYETKLKDYVIGVDTMGFDSQIPQEILNFLDSQVEIFRQSWEQKEYKMLLDDILQYIEQELTLENIDNYFKDQEKGIISTYQSQIKEQFANRQKQAQFELTLVKVGKLIKILSETMYTNSLNAYLNYNMPKYTEIVQIVLMLLGYPKKQINLPRSNTLNYRKYIQKKNIEKMLAELQKYQLRRESSEVVENQYKINKLLERLQKIDGEAVGKYNGWLFALLFIAKQLCWARIQCRDAKIQAFEARTKAKNDRDAEIVKYDDQIEKALQTAKAELNEQTLPTFSEQQWRKAYAIENVRPEALQVDELKTFLDLE